ncbi:MAG TPA: radical SAM protein [bacterium]|nr:radical SAM protein [bacterium]
MIYIKIHGMPCPNRCRHCCYFGGPDKEMMSREQVEKILTHAVDLKEQFQHVVIQMFDEPTMHPHFLDIVETQNALGLAWEGWFIPTNGSGLARMDDSGWGRLRDAGRPELQLTFYGLESAHDAFAGRKGAYADLVHCARAAGRQGIGWTAGIVAWPGNVRDLPVIRETILNLAPGCTGAGWFLPAWQGRAQDSDLRCRAGDLEYLKLPPAHFRPEKAHIKTILYDESLGSRTAADAMCDFMSMEVYPDMTVVHGGACDAAPPPELVPRLTIGTLTDAGFDPLVERLRNDPPELVNVLKNTSWRTLAENSGDPDGEGIFSVNDIVANKWMTDFLS